MIITLFFDYNTFGELSKAIYIISILLLIAVLIFGIEVKGSKSWFDFKVVNFQPSELVKIGFIISFAKLLEKREGNLNNLKGVLPIVLYIIPIVGLIILQNDFGTALVFIFFIAFMLFAAGISYRYVMVQLSLGY